MADQLKPERGTSAENPKVPAAGITAREIANPRRAARPQRSGKPRLAPGAWND
jgi:hypothetical protein